MVIFQHRQILNPWKQQILIVCFCFSPHFFYISQTFTRRGISQPRSCHGYCEHLSGLSSLILGRFKESHHSDQQTLHHPLMSWSLPMPGQKQLASLAEPKPSPCHIPVATGTAATMFHKALFLPSKAILKFLNVCRYCQHSLSHAGLYLTWWPAPQPFDQFQSKCWLQRRKLKFWHQHICPSSQESRNSA